MSNASSVMVTGGAGFAGSYIVAALVDAGFDVTVLDMAEPSPEGRFILGERYDRARYEKGSIDDWSFVMDVMSRCKPRYIVHTASIMNPHIMMKNPLPGIRANLDGTVVILEVMRLLGGVERLVYFSSIGVLPTIQYEPVDAAHPIFLPREGVPTGTYGATKIAGEAFCFAYHHAFGIDFRIIRPSAVYGFGMQWPMFVKPMIEAALAGRDVHFESGAKFPRDYTHVADIASLTLAMLSAPDNADRIFYGATGAPLVTAGQVAQIVMEEIPGSRITIEDHFTEADLMELPYRGQLSVESNRTQLGWEPAFDIRAGIRHYIDASRRFHQPGESDD